MRFREWFVVAGAAGLPARPPLPRPLEAGEWPTFLGDLGLQRLAGLALLAVEEGRLPVSEAQHQELADLHLSATATSLQLERHIVRVAALLEPHGIPFRVLKGSAVAHLDYSDPALRPFGDIDVLFRADDLDQALQVLTSAGYTRGAPQAREGFDRRFGKGATLYADDGLEVDVHRTFAMGPYGYTVHADDLWPEHDVFRLAGNDVAALAVEPRLLHACFHSVVGNPHQRIQPHRDVAEMFLYTSYSPERLLDLAQRWQASAVVATALTTTWDLLGIGPEPPILGWARAHVPSRREARMMALYGPETSYAAKSLGSLRVMSWRDRVAFLQMLAWSDRDFARGRSRGRWLLRGTSRAIHDRSTHGTRSRP